MILDKKDYNSLESHLYRYKDIERRVEEYKSDVINGSTSLEMGTGIGGSYSSDPTAIKAMKLCSESLIEDEKWLKAIQKVILRFQGTIRGDLLEKKYFKNERMIDIMLDLHIEKTTCYLYKDEIIYYFALVVTQEGLIKF